MKLHDDHLDFGTCFIRYAYSRPCTLSNDAPVQGRFEVPPQDSQTATIATLSADPKQGVIEAKACSNIEYSLVTLILGEIAFATSITAVPGEKQTTLPLKIEALSIGMSFSVANLQKLWLGVCGRIATSLSLLMAVENRDIEDGLQPPEVGF